MGTCTICKKQFEPYEVQCDCDCDGGMEEIQHDYMMQPEFRICHTCQGEGVFTRLEHNFCSDSCREEWWDQQNEDY